MWNNALSMCACYRCCMHMLAALQKYDLLIYIYLYFLNAYGWYKYHLLFIICLSILYYPCYYCYYEYGYDDIIYCLLCLLVFHNESALLCTMSIFALWAYMWLNMDRKCVPMMCPCAGSGITMSVSWQYLCMI